MSWFYLLYTRQIKQLFSFSSKFLSLRGKPKVIEIVSPVECTTPRKGGHLLVVLGGIIGPWFLKSFSGAFERKLSGILIELAWKMYGYLFQSEIKNGPQRS